MLSSENKALIRTYLWEPYRSDILSIEIWGSSVIDFLQNKHDIDVVIVCDAPEGARKLRSEIGSRALSEYKKNYNLCIRIMHKTNLVDSKLMRSYEWQSIYREVIFGSDVALEVRDIMEYKTQYIDSVKYIASTLLATSKRQHIFDTKEWYRIYVGIGMLKNDAYQLTDEQKTKVQILHDLEVTNRTYLDSIIECLDFLRLDSKYITTVWEELYAGK